jgi:hypothetical protein
VIPKTLALDRSLKMNNLDEIYPEGSLCSAGSAEVLAVRTGFFKNRTPKKIFRYTSCRRLKNGEIMNESQILQKVLKSFHRRRYLVFLLLSFLAGCLLTGFLLYRPRPGAVGILDKRFNSQYARAAETVGRLEAELEHERRLNKQLREHNQRARDIAGGLTETTNRNVRNLQDAVAIIGEVRKKLKVLEDFYNNSNPGNGGN